MILADGLKFCKKKLEFLNVKSFSVYVMVGLCEKNVKFCKKKNWNSLIMILLNFTPFDYLEYVQDDKDRVFHF